MEYDWKNIAIIIVGIITAIAFFIMVISAGDDSAANSISVVVGVVGLFAMACLWDW